MSRIFNHKKQYACTEVFRLEALQTLAAELETAEDKYCHGTSRFTLAYEMSEAAEVIREFIKNLEEQERRS